MAIGSKRERGGERDRYERGERNQELQNSTDASMVRLYICANCEQSLEQGHEIGTNGLGPTRCYIVVLRAGEKKRMCPWAIVSKYYPPGGEHLAVGLVDFQDRPGGSRR